MTSPNQYLPPIIREKCGTTAGHQKHRWEHEIYCEKCIEANRLYRQNRMSKPENREKKRQENRIRRERNYEKVRAQERASGEKHKEKRLVRARQYHAENREKINRKTREYKRAHPELTKAQYRRYAERNKEKIAAYRLAHREEAKTYKAEYYLRNREKIAQYREDNKERTAAWRKATPELSRQNVYKRRARKHAVASEPYTTQQILDLYGTDCHICKEPIDLNAPRTGRSKGYERGLHLDHVIPLVKGGTDLMENVKPSHALCNIQKNSKVL